MECAAILDVMRRQGTLEPQRYDDGKLIQLQRLFTPHASNVKVEVDDGVNVNVAVKRVKVAVNVNVNVRSTPIHRSTPLETEPETATESGTAREAAEM
jgi:hypothetical protein